MPPVNLLPPELRAQRALRTTQSYVLLAAVGLLVLLTIVTVIQRGRLASERGNLAQEQARTEQVRTEVGRLQQFAELESQVTSRKATLRTALTADVSWSKLMNDLALIIPDNSWLTGMTLTAAAAQAPNGQQAFGQATFQGFVFDFPGLAGWLTRVAQIDGLTFVYLGNGTRQVLESREVVAFNSTASITLGLLSQRCQAEGKPCP